MKSFSDFEIWIDPPRSPGADGDSSFSPVQVVSSPAGVARGELCLTVDAPEFQAELVQVREPGPDMALRRSFGERLFQALFNGKVRDAWQQSRGRADAGDAGGLRLRLCINVPQLAALPWELLWDGGFLATASDLVVSRYLPVPEPPVLLGQEHLRVLGVVESPAGFPIPTSAVQGLEAALKNLGERVAYDVLHNPTIGQIQERLQQDYHALHFLGHGLQGQLMLSTEDGRPAPIDEESFAQLVYGRRTLRLAVLTACHSGQAEERGLFAGIGPALVKKRVPAVIAMQYSTVYLDTAIYFSSAFYGALTQGKAVDAAVNEARQFLSAAGFLADRDWSTPVLFMGTRSGRILDFSQGDERVDRDWNFVQAAAEASEEARVALQDLAQRFEEVGALHLKVEALATLSNHLKDMQAAFALCADVVARTRGVVANLDYRELARLWKAARQDHLEALRLLTERFADGDTAAWFPPLMRSARNIDSHLKNIALVPLSSSVETFSARLAYSDNYVRQQMSRTIAELIAYSNRTLGRLSVM